MKHHARIIALCGVGSLLTLNPSVTRACSAPACDRVVVRVAPESGQTIPANAPGLALVVERCGAPDSVTLLDAQGMELQTVSGASQGGQLLLNFGAPLTPGTSYRVRGNSVPWQFPQSDGGDVATETSFTASAAAPLPTATGTLGVSYRLSQAGSTLNYLPTYATVVAAVADLTLTPAAELAPFAPVIRYITWVDDQYWATTAYGQSFASPEVPAVVTFRDPTRIHASCGRSLQSASCEPTGVSPGLHTVRVQAQLAGAAVDPAPVTIAIDLKCPTDGGGVDGDGQVVDGDSGVDADGQVVDAGGQVVDGSDGGSTTPDHREVTLDAAADAAQDRAAVAPAIDAPTSSDSSADGEGAPASGVVVDGGCSVALPAGEGRAPWALVAAAGAVALGLRRRRPAR